MTQKKLIFADKKDKIRIIAIICVHQMCLRSISIGYYRKQAQKSSRNHKNLTTEALRPQRRKTWEFRRVCLREPTRFLRALRVFVVQIYFQHFRLAIVLDGGLKKSAP